MRVPEHLLPEIQEIALETIQHSKPMNIAGAYADATMRVLYRHAIITVKWPLVEREKV